MKNDGSTKLIVDGHRNNRVPSKQSTGEHGYNSTTIDATIDRIEIMGEEQTREEDMSKFMNEAEDDVES
jgi:hypothetical protein